MLSQLQVEDHRHITMPTLSFYVYIILANSYFLAIGIHGMSVHPNPVSTTDESPTTTATTTQRPDTTQAENATAEEQNANNSNNTLAAISITDYYYYDWPRIGYQIFMKKMLEALRILNIFSKMDPMLLTIKRTFILGPGNNTESDYSTDNNTAATNNEEYLNQPVESTTESPLNSNPTENPMQATKSENSEKTKDEDVKETKVKSEGFFSKVASVFHSLTSWF